MVTIFKQARVRAGKKQLELERETGIDRCRLSMIENGWREPKPEELEKLKRVLPGIE